VRQDHLPYYKGSSCSLPLLLSMVSSNNRSDLKISLFVGRAQFKRGRVRVVGEQPRDSQEPAGKGESLHLVAPGAL
jgi:hypothetical protein